MVKACKIEATLMNSPFSAKYRPGHILGVYIASALELRSE